MKWVLIWVLSSDRGVTSGHKNLILKRHAYMLENKWNR